MGREDHHDLSALSPLATLPGARPRRAWGAAVLGENGSTASEATEAGVRVLLVDDHDLFRTGLRTLLEEQGVEIVGEAANGDDAVMLVEEHAPDVVLMDLDMPGKGGIGATREIAAVAPLTRVVVLTISDQDADVMDAVVAGACGYLLKDAHLQDLLRRAQSRGESGRVPDLAGHRGGRCSSACAPRARGSRDGPATNRAPALGPRPPVLKLIANGKDNAQIAGELFISAKTVKNHIWDILLKLQHREPHTGGRLRGEKRFSLGPAAGRRSAADGGAHFACALLEQPEPLAQAAEVAVDAGPFLRERRELLRARRILSRSPRRRRPSACRCGAARPPAPVRSRTRPSRSTELGHGRGTTEQNIDALQDNVNLMQH